MKHIDIIIKYKETLKYKDMGGGNERISQRESCVFPQEQVEQKAKLKTQLFTELMGKNKQTTILYFENSLKSEAERRDIGNKF